MQSSTSSSDGLLPSPPPTTSISESDIEEMCIIDVPTDYDSGEQMVSGSSSDCTIHPCGSIKNASDSAEQPSSISQPATNSLSSTMSTMSGSGSGSDSVFCSADDSDSEGDARMPVKRRRVYRKTGNRRSQRWSSSSNNAQSRRRHKTHRPTAAVQPITVPTMAHEAFPPPQMTFSAAELTGVSMHMAQAAWPGYAHPPYVLVPSVQYTLVPSGPFPPTPTMGLLPQTPLIPQATTAPLGILTQPGQLGMMTNAPAGRVPQSPALPLLSMAQPQHVAFV